MRGKKKYEDEMFVLLNNVKIKDKGKDVRKIATLTYEYESYVTDTRRLLKRKIWKLKDQESAGRADTRTRIILLVEWHCKINVSRAISSRKERLIAAKREDW